MSSAGTAADPGLRFAAAMSAAGPFEAAPHLAIALSGGADSTALTLLARDWVQARGGTITALIVDHGLRAASADEARAVAAWCARRAIAHAVLSWAGVKPTRAIQERARTARHDLLEAWCRDAGVLHLLLGHHADDQRETIAMRAAKASGDDGLAGMALISERSHVRLLRPMLGIGRDALRVWLRGQAESWIEDPSNRDKRFLRVRLRDAMTPAMGGDPSVRARGDAERGRADWLGVHAAIHPEGWASFDLAGFRALAPAPATAMLRAGVMTVSGAVHPPRSPALEAAAAWARQARAGASRCVHGCVLAIDGRRLSILRNPAAVRAAPMVADTLCFDRRFRVRFAVPTGGRLRAVVPLRQALSMGISAKRAPCLLGGASLPAAQALDGSVGLLHVLYGRGSLALVSVDSMDVSFRPVRPLAGAAFAGLRTVKLSSTPESLAGAERSAPRLPERVVPP